MQGARVNHTFLISYFRQWIIVSRKIYDRRPSSRMNMIISLENRVILEYHSFSSQIVEVRSSRWQLAILRARPTTEFGVILVPTIARHHDKIALCEEAVVLTIGMNKYACNEKDEKISRSFSRARVCACVFFAYQLRVHPRCQNRTCIRSLLRTDNGPSRLCSHR